MAEQLDFTKLRNAVTGPAAAFRCRIRLQPDGGDGGKLFPPTYAGGIYAVEDRRINGNIVRCVLLDSVQSQANRMEEALQDVFLPNWRELKADGADPECALPVIAVHIENHGCVTSLTAPHRIHDAILRDSEIQEEKNGKRSKARFRDSQVGREIVASRLYNATAFYKYCPTALLFGTWDSTAGEGLDSAKIPRAIVSEIVGVNVTAGVRTGSRIDPLGIKAQSATVYKRTDGGWAIKDEKDNWVGAESESEIEKDKQGNPKKFGKGRPSDINHGNVMPDITRFDRDDVRKQNLDRLPDILESNPLTLRYDVKSAHGRLENHLAYSGETVRIRDGAIKPGGVTMEYALHTWTLSLTQLRRLRFPIQNPTVSLDGTAEGKPDECNAPARTVLAALALYALALQNDRGHWLRSRCELIPEGDVTLELLDGSGSEFSLPSAEDVRKDLLDPAIKGAERLGLTWQKTLLRLTPTRELTKLVELSDARRPEESEAEIEDTGEATADASAED